MMANDDKVAAPAMPEITSQIARYVYDRLVFAGPVSAAAVICFMGKNSEKSILNR
jgi:hypothetical protein